MVRETSVLINEFIKQNGSQLQTANQLIINNATTSSTTNNELTGVQEFARYLVINLICLITIVVLMSFCYVVHVLYNSAWKPFKM